MNRRSNKRSRIRLALCNATMIFSYAASIVTMDTHTYLIFVAAVVVLILVPGPDMVYMLARTMAQGRKAGVWAAIGFNAGGYVHMLGAVLGLSAILATSSVAFTAVKWLGACYLVWLGVQALAARSTPLLVEGGARPHADAKTIFWQGFLSDVLNPKVAIFFLAFLPQFVDVAASDRTQQLIVLGLTINVIAIAINLVLVYFASAATSRLRRSPKVGAYLHKSMGAVFVALGIRLATEKL
jgi:threonine/homoserine/homoserine lactone efflux protein